MNTDAKVHFERAQVERQERYNPIRNLTPESLTGQIDSFYAGYLAPFARTMAAIKVRDDVIQPASAKRDQAPSRRNWEVIINAKLPPGMEAEAEKHKAALTFFYDNLSVTNAVDLNCHGGMRLLRRQMMEAVGFKYAVHHIVWRPTPDGLTAELIYCPLWFFENRTGRLRFLSQPHSFDGEEMLEGEWLVSIGEGIMEASAVAYMFKRLPLRDWLIMSQDFGKPVVEGITDEALGTDGWNKVKEAVEAVAADLRLVRSRSAEIKLTDLAQTGNMPYEPLVERMDRRLAAIWRGGDLGTISRADGVGAEGQSAETDLIEEGDCEWLSDTLNLGLDKLVIANVFGEEVTPLAYVKVIYPRRQNIAQELEVDTFLRDSGAPLGTRATLERYGRTEPDPKDVLLTKPAPPPSPFGAPPPANEPPPPQETAANEAAPDAELEALVTQAAAEGVGARRQWLAPLSEEIRRLIATVQNGRFDDAQVTRLIEAGRERLPELFAELDPAAYSAHLNAVAGRAALEGLKAGLERPADTQ